jgi:hypothetical protein
MQSRPAGWILVGLLYQVLRLVLAQMRMCMVQFTLSSRLHLIGPLHLSLIQSLQDSVPNVHQLST